MATDGAVLVAKRAALITILGVLLLTFLDTTIVSVALGDMQFDLGAGVVPLQWVVNAYSLVFASLMLVAGALGDRFGRRTVMVGGIALFCAGSLLCALAGDVSWVIAGRAVMGAGAAASEPGTLSVIRQLYPERSERARAFGAWGAVSGLALAVGPVVGGTLVAIDGWRAIFWFNLALGLVGIPAMLRWVPQSADPRPGRPDVWGFVLGAAALATVIYAGIAGELYGYGTPWIVALFAIGGICAVAFVVVERRSPDPMLDLRYLTDRAIGAALLMAFLAYFGVFSIFFLAALYLDLLVGYSGWRSAGLFAPMAVAIVVGAIGSGRWVAARGARAPMVVGAVLAAAGIALTGVLLTARPNFAGLVGAYVLAGVGFGVVVVPITSAVLGNVPAARSGMAASATNTARQLGVVVGVAALGAIVNSYVTHDFGRALANSPSAGASGFIMGLIERGGPGARGVDLAHPSQLIANLVDQAAAAFRSGLHAALWASALLLLLGAAYAALVPRGAFAREGEP